MTAPVVAPGRPDPVADRGRLTIADQVVEKIATAALGEVDRVGGPPRAVLGIPMGARSRGPAEPDGRPRVRARVSGTVATLQVRCSVAYPAPVARTAELARAHLVARIGELTGLTAAQVDITVSALTAGPTGPGEGW